jgi:polysaccharide deacetylase 2 family uncharacterized protein YibQ
MTQTEQCGTVTMATRSSSRNKSTSSVKRRTSTAKKRSKSSTPRKRKKPPRSKKGLFFTFLLLIAASLVAFGYYLGQNGHTPSRKAVAESVPTHKVTKVIKPSVRTTPKATKPPVKAAVASPVAKPLPKSRKREQSKKAALAFRSKRPKLVIIIDDISSAKQLQRLKSLPFPVTPSIFPPYRQSMQSQRLAKGLKHYMVHLPMESGNRQLNRQYKTLKVSFSKAEMAARIKEIRRLFPHARYINNHTGSVFTSNKRAMGILYALMRREGFRFIDSRTSRATKVREIAHACGDAYVARDVFIDNTLTISAIHRQLRKAVKIAGKKGYAIAIGHPHKETMQALASAGDIFSGVELVYIDQIYRLW